jgi:hypothetical protein
MRQNTLGEPKPTLREAVLKRMEVLEEHPACSKATALGDLLDLVRTRLLIVGLPKALAMSGDPTVGVAPVRSSTGNSSSLDGITGISIKVTVYDADDSHQVTASEKATDSDGLVRARATELKDHLVIILDNGLKNNSYWLTDTSRKSEVIGKKPVGSTVTGGKLATSTQPDISDSSSSAVLPRFDSNGDTFFDSGAYVDSNTEYGELHSLTSSTLAGAKHNPPKLLVVQNQENVGTESSP